MSKDKYKQTNWWWSKNETIIVARRLCYECINNLMFASEMKQKHCICTILTSDSELIDSTYIVTPTSTGGPAIRNHKNTVVLFRCLFRLMLLFGFVRFAQVIMLYLVFCLMIVGCRCSGWMFILCVNMASELMARGWNTAPNKYPNRIDAIGLRHIRHTFERFATGL